MDVAISGDIGAENSGSASVPEAAVAAGSMAPVRSKALNLLRFASVLVGAGLLLRVGASEQANSAIDDEKAPVEKPKITRIAMPQPAFGLPLDVSGNAAIANNSATLPAVAQKIAKAAQAGGKSPSMRAEAPTPSFASAFGPALDGPAVGATAELAAARIANSESTAIAPASSTAPANVSAAKSRLESRSPAKNNDARQLAGSVDALAGVPASAAAPSAVLGTARRAKPSTGAKGAQTVSLTSRRTAAEGLLAPVRITSASDRSLLAPVTAAPRSASSTPVAAPMAKANSGRAAGPQASAGLANAQPRTAPLTPAAANPLASSVNPNPVQISLVAPVMTRGPRTTVLTSNIADVMRRPASAWEYAEALSPELSGAVRRSASAQPSVAAPPAQTAASPAAPRQMIAGPAPRVSAPRSGQVAPSQVKTAPAERTVAVQPQAVVPAPAGAKIGLAPPRSALPVRALRAGPKKTAPLDFNRDQVELKALEPEVAELQAAGPSRVSYESKALPGPAAEGSADTAAESYAESYAGDTTTLSLLDRMPRPAF